MTNKDPYGAYNKASTAVSEINQVIMLYEGAINFIEQAKEAIEEKNYEKRYNLINKSISIVTGLNSCLDFNEQTEEVAQALDQYYQSIDMRLLYIQCNNSLADCDEVIADLRVMLDAWKDVAQETEGVKVDENSEDPAPNEDEGAKQDVEITI